jgi:membrane-associated protease RseP (regulator of RpoE activity)
MDRLSATRRRSRLGLAGEEERNGRDRQDDTNDGEGVAEADDESLALHDIADGDDRLVLRRGGIGDAVREEVVRRVGDALPHLVAIERHRLTDDVRMELLVLAIQPDGRGADLGISPGDVILDVSGKPVQTPDGVRSALQDEYDAGRSATMMRIKSGEMTRFVVAGSFDPA